MPRFGIITIDQKIKSDEPVELQILDQSGRHVVIGRRAGEEKGEENLIFLGKVIQEGPTGSNYKNYNLWLDITRPHVIFTCGKRGEGKSYDLGVILEGLASTRTNAISTKYKAVSAIVFDTQDQFWTMKFPLSELIPEDKKQLESLKEWKLKPTIFKARVFVPTGIPKLLKAFETFSLNPAELDASDWCGLFGIDPFEPSGHLILVTYNKVVRDGYFAVERDLETTEVVKREKILPKKEYSIDDLKKCILTDEEITDPRTGFAQNTIRAIVSRLDWAKELPIFGASPLNINELLQPGQISILLIRELSDSTKALVVGIITKKVFEKMGRLHRMEQMLMRLKAQHETITGDKKQIVDEIERLEKEVGSQHRIDQAWLLIDEVHVVCPSSGYTAAKEKLIEFVKRGRDSGLSMVFATQQPAAVNNQLLSQLDLLMVHRLATYKDMAAASENAVSPLPQRVKIGRNEVTSHAFEALLRSLRRSEAVIVDAQTNLAFCAKIRPRISPHGGSEPILRVED